MKLGNAVFAKLLRERSILKHFFCYRDRVEQTTDFDGVTRLRENSIPEGHGFSRAAKVTAVDGFSR
jgi:hypothetical protein